MSDMGHSVKAEKANRQLKIALMGFGNAGRAFARLLLQKKDALAEAFGAEVMVTVIATATRGNLVCGEGVDLRRALADMEAEGRLCDERTLTTKTGEELLEAADYDVLAELTPLSIADGQPATSHIERALARKKHVITANKGPVAWAFDRLRRLAEEAGVCFFYETTVMDGTPVFNLAAHTLKLAEVTEVSGILNSTTNFILEGLAAGCSYDDIMERGRRMGFVEADPSMDIEGYDAAAKITALLNVLMDAKLTPDMVERRGIGDITAERILDAKKRGKVIKLMCRGWRGEDGAVGASVCPEELDSDDLMATVNSTTSAVSITTDLMKKITVVEHEPEIEQTAYGIFSDVLRVLTEAK